MLSVSLALALPDCTLTDNSATSSGGAIDAFNNSTLTINGSTFSNNSATWGGAIFFNSGGVLTITSSTFTGNSASSNGGGIDSLGTLNVTDCTLSGNSAIWGGGICSDAGNSAFSTVAGSTLSDNSAYNTNPNNDGGNGGGIILYSGTLTVTSSTLSGNSAYTTTPNNWGGNGGGIENYATLTVTNSTLNGNFANCSLATTGTTAGDGGGIFNQGTLTVTSSTLSGNSAYTTNFSQGQNFISEGGAICNIGAITVVTNSTITGNSAFWGGAIENRSTLTLTCSTVSGNTAYYEVGGIDNDNNPPPIFTMTSSIVAGNIVVVSAATNPTPQVDVGAGLFNAGSGVQSTSSYNLIGNGDGMTGISNNDGNHNLVGTTASPINPLLNTLGWYGGPTQTMALLSGSPAIGTGNPLPEDAGGNLITTDQRGLPRTNNLGTDIGSFETQPPTFTSANVTNFTVGTAGSFTVTATGYPAVTGYTETGSLPNGVAFNTTTGVLSGTPAAGTGGSYSITFTAANGITPNTTQTFNLIVDQAPAITSGSSTAFTVGTPGSFTVTATGYPTPILT